MTKIKTYEFAPIEAPGHITFFENQCFHCGGKNEIYVFEKDYLKWKNGDYIQSAFPYLSDAQREVIKTGIHPECWKQIFPEVEN